MLIKKLLIFFQMYLLAQLALAQESQPKQQKLKLAVLRISYEAFTEEEKETVNRKIYQDLAKDGRVMVITEAEVREKLIPLGLEPAEITNEQGYTMVGQLLQTDYLLIGTMDKIGHFVDVTFRLFKMPSGTHKRYPGGKTLDALVKEEIPNLISLIYKDIGLQEEHVAKIEVPEKEPEKTRKEEAIVPQKSAGRKLRWVLIGTGTVAAGIIGFLVINKPPPPPEEFLPRPPFVP